MTTDVSDQERPITKPVAAGDGNGNQLPPDTAQSSEDLARLVAQLLLDDEDKDDRLAPRHGEETLPQEPFLGGPTQVAGALPIETAAEPAGTAMSGGGSRYDGDFGQLISGLRSSASGAALAGTQTPGGGTPVGTGSPGGGDLLPFFARASNFANDGEETSSGGDDTGGGGGDEPGGGDDTGTGGGAGSGGGDTTSGGDDTGGGGDDTGGGGPTVLPELFTVHPDSVDFNTVIAGTYREGTQYDADNQNDLVFLPNDAARAMQAGFAIGTLFLAGNGDDTVIGGGLADLIDGGNGRDLLFGGDDDDTLIGGTGMDTLVGGLGDDLMTGGQGKDSFRFSLSANEGKDLILDFQAGKGGDVLQITDLVDVTGEGKLTVADLDAGGHSVSGQADAIVITFGGGTSITLVGLDGAGVNSFAELVKDAKVQLDIQ